MLHLQLLTAAAAVARRGVDSSNLQGCGYAEWRRTQGKSSWYMKCVVDVCKRNVSGHAARHTLTTQQRLLGEGSALSTPRGNDLNIVDSQATSEGSASILGEQSFPGLLNHAQDHHDEDICDERHWQEDGDLALESRQRPFFAPRFLVHGVPGILLAGQLILTSVHHPTDSLCTPTVIASVHHPQLPKFHYHLLSHLRRLLHC
eukprot:gene194-3581_t